VQRSPVRRILAGHRILQGSHGWLHHAEAVGGTRPENVQVFRRDLGTHLPQRGDVVQNPEPPAVGRHYQVREMFLHRDAVHRCRRKIRLERLPILAVVEGDVERVFGPQI
jgi:hypothetical protein